MLAVVAHLSMDEASGYTSLSRPTPISLPRFSPSWWATRLLAPSAPTGTEAAKVSFSLVTRVDSLVKTRFEEVPAI